MKLSLKKVQKLVMNRRLTKTQVDVMGLPYARGYTDAINVILTDIYRIKTEQLKQMTLEAKKEIKGQKAISYKELIEKLDKL